jgi:hypothetical protein
MIKNKPIINLGKNMKKRYCYINRKKVISVRWYGEKTEDNFVKCELLAKNHYHGSEGQPYNDYLVKLPNGKIIKVDKVYR